MGFYFFWLGSFSSLTSTNFIKSLRLFNWLISLATTNTCAFLSSTIYIAGNAAFSVSGYFFISSSLCRKMLFTGRACMKSFHSFFMPRLEYVILHKLH